ncbi:conserved hypothetical protein [metagenome]|uniref:ABC transporter substrate-binding protein n=1 Tax=metagenome TaxID=256318 RepID=A0A2P2C9Y5_9ZZZZ
MQDPPRVSVACTPALASVLTGDILPLLGQGAGPEVEVDYLTTLGLRTLLEEGGTPDVVIGVDTALRDLVRAGHLPAGTHVPLAHCGIGVAVGGAVGSPPMETVEDLIDLVLSADSVCYSSTGASGLYFGRLLEELGVAEAVNARATVIARGLVAEQVVGGVADVGIQLTPELLQVDGVRILGPLPAAVQQEMRVALAVPRASAATERLVELLVSPVADAAYARRGLEPLDHSGVAVASA